jgi:L-histidine N-alpha-methyltransferase
MKQLAWQDYQVLNVPYKALKDYEDLFLEKRSGHLTGYIYGGEVDYYDKLVQEERNYYLTRTEISILEKHKHDISKAIGENCNVVEIGPGPEYISETKLIPLLREFKSLSSYTAVDINLDYAIEASEFIRQSLGNINCFAHEGDCTMEMPRYHNGKTCLLFLGTTLANFTTIEIYNTFASFYNALREGEHMIFSIDCNEDLSSLKKAYDNAIVEQLTFKVIEYFKDLFMINDFDPSAFKFEYKWSYDQSAVHLNLISEKEQRFYFNHNEIFIPKHKKYTILRSRRFKKALMDSICFKSGFTIKNSFTDDRKRIIVYVLEKGDFINRGI